MDILKQIGVWFVRALAVLGGLVLVLVVLAIASALLLRGPQIPADAVLKIELAGELPETAPVDLTAGLLGSPTVTFKDQLDNFKKAARDSRIKGVVIDLDGFGGGWAKAEELRDAIAEFRKSGKFVVGYAEGINERAYYLALAMDQLFMPPTGYFEMNGLVTEVTHWPGLLQKLGVGIQYFRYGKYKSVSGESFGRAETTAPVKEMINVNLTEQFETFVGAVAQARKLSPAQVRTFIDSNRPTAEWALSNKLIDGIAYWDEVESGLKKRLSLDADQKLETVSASDYQGVPLSDFGLNTGADKIGLIYSVGLIVAGEGGGPNILAGGASQGSEPIIRALREAEKRADIKAIVFRVDSPGGAGLGCDFVRREVERLRKIKPVVVSMSDSAASGGYWVSMAASAIVAEPSTATGSIGIYSVIPNVETLYRNLTITPEIYKRGARADALRGNRPLNPEEAKIFDEELLKNYRRFVSLAAAGRGKSVAAMEAVAQGRTWSGRKALQLGLVDKLGGLDTAVALAAEKAKIKAGTAAVEKLDQEKGAIETLLGQNASHWLLSALGIERTSREWAPPLTPDLLREHRLFPLALPLRID